MMHKVYMSEQMKTIAHCVISPDTPGSTSGNTIVQYTET